MRKSNTENIEKMETAQTRILNGNEASSRFTNELKISNLLHIFNGIDSDASHTDITEHAWIIGVVSENQFRQLFQT